MKKVLLAILVIMLSFNCFATSSPTLKGLIWTNPEIPFEFNTEIEDGVFLTAIYDLFGTRIANTFTLYESLILDVQTNWEVVELKFMQEFGPEDTVIAIFNNDEEVNVLFLEYENGVFPIDFTLVPNGHNIMYIISDYEG